MTVVYGPRTRTQSVPTKSASWSYHVDNYQGICSDVNRKIVNTTSSGNAVISSGTDVMHDIVTENYLKIKSMGGIINSAMDKTTITRVEPIGIYITDNRNYVSGCTPVRDLLMGGRTAGTIPGYLFAPDPVVSTLSPVPQFDLAAKIDIAVTAAWAKASQSDAAILCTLGEGKESIKMFRDIIKKLIVITKKFKRLEFLALARMAKPKELANIYMGFRYGIRPLYYDVQMILKAINHQKPEHDRFTYRGYKVHSAATTASQNTTSGELTWKYVGKATRSVEIRAGVLTQVEDISPLAYWGAYDIPQAVWELTPLSFCIDWFINIGKTIASWTPAPGLKMLASWYTVNEIIYQEIKGSAVSFNPVQGARYIAPEFQYDCLRAVTTVKKYRVPDPTRSVLPHFNVKLDTLKILDLVLILRNIFFKGK